MCRAPTPSATAASALGAASHLGLPPPVPRGVSRAGAVVAVHGAACRGRADAPAGRPHCDGHGRRQGQQGFVQHLSGRAKHAGQLQRVNHKPRPTPAVQRAHRFPIH